MECDVVFKEISNVTEFFLPWHRNISKVTEFHIIKLHGENCKTCSFLLARSKSIKTRWIRPYSYTLGTFLNLKIRFNTLNPPMKSKITKLYKMNNSVYVECTVRSDLWRHVSVFAILILTGSNKDAVCVPSSTEKNKYNCLVRATQQPKHQPLQSDISWHYNNINMTFLMSLNHTITVT